MSSEAVTCDLVFSGEARAWYAGVPLKDYILKAEAAYEVAVRSRDTIRQRFAVDIGLALMGFSYGSLLSLGVSVRFLDDGTPCIRPCLDQLEDFLRWGEYRPFDNDLAQRLISVWRAVNERLGEVSVGLPFGNEAPFTAAVLLRGERMCSDLIDRPALAKAFLARLTNNWLLCHRAVAELQGRPVAATPIGLADDFAGMVSPRQFHDFVLPTYRRIFEETRATERHLHSELLRPGHLPALGELGLDSFDPHVDQYLTPEDLKRHLPGNTPWQWRVVTSHMVINTPEEVVGEYERGVRHGAKYIRVVVMPGVPEENIRAVIEVGEKHGVVTGR